jgi:hypothetical protein
VSADGGPVSHVAGPRGEEEERAARLHAAAEAVADGGWPPAGLGDASADPLIPEFDIIARIAQVHQAAAGGRAATEDGRHSSESLGDILSRSVVPMTTRPDVTGARRWGPLFVLERVGGGSFGEVYRAWDPALDREVALKLLRVPSTSPGRASTFVREGQLLASVRHPNVINVHGAAQIDGEVGLWMEFVRGRTLEQIVLEDGPMSAQEATVIAESLCRALSAVHQQGLLHRDIKAANVMRASGGRIVLLDFGTGTEVASCAGGSPGIAGTPLYMAPEVLEGAPATVQSDVYSLGVLLFFLVTGSFPVYGKSLAEVRAVHQRGDRVLLSDVRSDLPAAFTNTVEKAISPDPQSRIASPGRMRTSFGSSEESPRRSTSILPPVAVIMLAAPLLAAILGYVTSLAFKLQLGIEGDDFLSEGFFMQMEWGARSVVSTLVYTGIAGVLTHMAALLWRLATTIGGVRSVRDRLVQWRHAFTVHAGLDDPSARMQAVLAGGLLLLAVVCGAFLPLLRALTVSASTAPSAVLNPLNPRHVASHVLYGLSLDMTLFVVLALAWRVETSARRGGRTSARGAIVGVLVVAALPLLLHAAAWRVLFQSQFRLASVEGRQCYVLDEEGTEVLLHCPGGEPPRNRVLNRSDATLSITGQFGSLFEKY